MNDLLADMSLQLAENELVRLIVAFLIGALVGTERGWRQRDMEQGERVAGLRTFALIGMLGGIGGLLGAPILAAALAAALTVLLAFGYRARRDLHEDVGLTTAVAALVTFGLGHLAGSGHLMLAAGGAVLTALALEAKSALHGWLEALAHGELKGALKLGLAGLVLLPVMPDQGFGPGEVIHPRTFLVIVLLLTGTAYVGHWLVRIFGQRGGPVLMGLFGGLASSTAVTISAAKLSRQAPNLVWPAATAVAAANMAMAGRILVIAAILAPTLAWHLLVPIGLLILVSLAAIAGIWIGRRGQATDAAAGELALGDPAPLGEAFLLAGIIVAVRLATEFARAALEGAGLLLVAMLAGLADLAAITVSLSEIAAGDGIAPRIAVAGILLATLTNTLAKSTLAYLRGTPRFALMAGALSFAAVLAAGAGWLFWSGAPGVPVTP